jgi:hypothetical protein
MGIDVHGLNLLRYSKSFGDFGKTVTIGRQGLDVSEAQLRSAIEIRSDHKKERYIETLLLRHFGADGVDSIDNSDYEHATTVHDMNAPIPSGLEQVYDTVIDGGCLEHIYNVPQALRNCSLLCKPGGQILHILPANNFCGHGFWQMSPELFFSLYSFERGYCDTDVFLADLSNTNTWFKVAPPKDGRRVNVHSSSELYVLTRTVRRQVPFSQNNVQQSDYIFGWQNGATNAGSPQSPAIRGVKALVQGFKRSISRALPPFAMRRYENFRSIRTSQLNQSNPGLSELKVELLLPTSADH